MAPSPVKITRDDDLDHAIDTIALAFTADPVVRWIFSDASQYLTYFRQIVRLHGSRAVSCQAMYQTEDFGAAAIWFPPNIEPDAEGLSKVFESALPHAERERVFSVLGQMAEYHLSEPHWYLRLIGVDPARQGCGYGSALLESALTHCDSDHIPAYLEATSERGLSLYQRFGFEAVGRIQTKGSPPMWPMVRQPR